MYTICVSYCTRLFFNDIIKTLLIFTDADILEIHVHYIFTVNQHIDFIQYTVNELKDNDLKEKVQHW